MNKIIKLFLIAVMFVISSSASFAGEYRVLVLPDNLQFESTNYYIYPDASILFASEVIDYLNHSKRVETVSMADIRAAFRADSRLKGLAKNTLKEFKYNYNISFVDIKSIAKTFGVDNVLLITSTTDAQNYILRRTIWDFLNIPGATVVDPVYKLSTFAALVDVNEEKILWQHTYHKNIGAFESRIIAVNFAPASEQLDKLKLYSSVLSPEIARHVEDGIIPFLPEVVKEPVQNVNVLAEPAHPQVVEIEDAVKVPYLPSRARKGKDSVINDL